MTILDRLIESEDKEWYINIPLRMERY
jgi:hypothetical protein